MNSMMHQRSSIPVRNWGSVKVHPDLKAQLKRLAYASGINESTLVQLMLRRSIATVAAELGYPTATTNEDAA